MTQTAPDSGPFPLTDLQSAYLVGASELIELGGFHPTYYVELDVAGFDPDRGQRALRQLIMRHEHLRTAVRADGSQQVLDQASVPPLQLKVIDLAGQAPVAQEEAIRQTRQRMCEQGVDPIGWPLINVVAHMVRRRRARIHIAMSLLLIDGQGIRQSVLDWLALYRDPSVTLPPVPITYRECLARLLAREDTDAYREQWKYWEDRLDSLPDAPRLPLARPLESIRPVRFTRRIVRLTQEEWQRLGVNFRRHKIMSTTAMLHVFSETLGQWAASPHFCLNVLHHNWGVADPGWTSVVGQFGSTLPLEVDLRAAGDFWTRGQRLQSQLWKDLRHSDVSGVRVTREIAARRGWTSRAAMPYVFTSMLAPATRSGALPPLKPSCRTVTSALHTPQVLIDNQIQDAEGGGVACVLDIVDDAFPPGLPDAIYAAYDAALHALAAAAGTESVPAPRPPSALAGGAVPRPEDRLEDGFLRQAREHPEATAVVTSGRTLSYGELAARSGAVARWLRDRSAGRGNGSGVVPVVMTKGWEQVIAVLGVIRAGAAYCPVDATLPAERVGYLLEECGSPVALGQSHSWPGTRLGRQVEVLNVDLLDSGSEPLPGEPAGTAEDLAYVIYTSGSTGQPKGVMIEHRAALNTVTDINQRLGLQARDVVFGVSSLSFDLSVWDIFGTLSAGGTLVLPDDTPRPDPMGWAAMTAAHGVTIWNSVPALAEMLVEMAEQRPGLGHPPIRAFLLSGDWIPTSLPGRMREAWPDLQIMAMGGATEASIWSNLWEVGRIDPSWRSIPYGRALRNQTMSVLDHELSVRPPWATGHIYIGGAGLARGYWRDEARTAERFITHPVTGERLYWTGDLGRYWPDGTIEFLGREDRQVKIQGFRIEPGEVEAAIRGHADVRECVVCSVAAAGEQRRLVAFVVRHPSGTVSGPQVAGYVRSRVPYYMVPSEVHIVERLPLTSNGKVDIARALALRGAVTPDAARAGAAADVSSANAGAPEGGDDGRLMARVHDLWAEILQVPRVSPEAEFFALGGNSVLALRLINRIHADLGIDVPFGAIFEAPTLRAFTRRMAASDQNAGGEVTLSTRPGQELVLLHPVGGAVTCYTSLARVWPGPVRAFQSRGLSGTAQAAGDPDLETMASGYRAQIQRVRPSGPYVLGGWSMGGVLAYEIGRQLAATGQSCSVFMIDSDITSTRTPCTEADRHLEFLNDLAGGDLPASVRESLRAAGPEVLTTVALDAAVALSLLPAEIGANGYLRLMRVHSHNLASLAAYRPRTAGMRTLLLVAGDVKRPEPSSAWRAACPGIEVEIWPGDHYSIMAGDRIPEIVKRVQAWLSLAAAR